MVVVGMAFPGLKDNLNQDEDKLEIPDYVEITADVTKFELASGIEALSDGVEELAGGLGALTSNNDTLNAGSRQVKRRSRPAEIWYVGTFFRYE